MFGRNRSELRESLKRELRIDRMLDAFEGFVGGAPGAKATGSPLADLLAAIAGKLIDGDHESKGARSTDRESEEDTPRAVSRRSGNGMPGGFDH